MLISGMISLHSTVGETKIQILKWIFKVCYRVYKNKGGKYNSALRTSKVKRCVELKYAVLLHNVLLFLMSIHCIKCVHIIGTLLKVTVLMKQMFLLSCDSFF